MSKSTSIYNKYLLFIAGLGGLLYGIDVGVIAGALPYLQATTNYSAGQLSTVVAAVLLGSVLSSLFAGALSDLFGRKKVMILAGICFVLSVPIICVPEVFFLVAGRILQGAAAGLICVPEGFFLVAGRILQGAAAGLIGVPEGFYFLVAGRILQGAAAGLIGVVVPLYLAECLTADKRGFGTGMFQFMLTVGLVFAAAVGLYFASHVQGIIDSGASGEEILSAKNFAWRAIFWACAVPGMIFTLGAFFVSESPRWLFKKDRKEAALKALERSRGVEAAKKEFDEMGESPDEAAVEKAAEGSADAPKDSIFKKKYIVPFVIAVVILACNQATGINSVLAYIVDILKQAGLDGSVANQGDLVVKILNMLMTVVAMILVDRKGRKFLLTLGTSGIIVGLLGVAALFFRSEQKMENFTANIAPETYAVTRTEAKIDEKTGLVEKDAAGNPVNVNVSYDFFAEFTPERVLEISKAKEFVPSQVKIVYSTTKDGEESIGMKTLVVKPFTGDPNDAKKFAAQKANWESEITFGVKNEKDTSFALKSIEIGPLPSEANGWLVTLFFAVFIASFAVGPGVCVWLALSELMPTRIRSNGMSIALLINQGVSTLIAGTFLPVVGNYGYSTIFFFCAGCTVIYWITAVFFLPETKGRTLEEIEAYFDGKKKL